MPKYLEVRQACGDAIDWIEANRRQMPRLDRESASLILRLRRARNKVRTLERAVQRPFTVGFFGLSQAGKSYLISALGANAKGALDVNLGGERLNFLTHINPPGGGREATGLVTRLTRRPVSVPPGFPVRLHLFSEADLVKVLGNTFFNDFDREQAPFEVDAERVRTHLARAEARRVQNPYPGLDADDVVDLQDYFERRFPRSMDPLKVDFWPSARDLAAFLDGDARAELFSLLWGGIPELTATFRRLQEVLARLDFAATVHGELSALVTRNAAGDWVPEASLVDVGILESLGQSQNQTLRVLPEVAGEKAAIAVARPELAVLTAEIELVLLDPPHAALLEEVDLLDFPGYRGRLSIASLDEVRKQSRDDPLDPVAQLVLRGKVAYLFERYTEDQEMNALVLCTPSNQQSDVNDLGPVLTSWIDLIQGPDPKTRDRQRPGLLWALTKFDQRLDVMPGQTRELMRSGWEGMMKLALLERFGRYDWLHEWTPGRCFDHLFLVRKPGKAGAVIHTEGEREQCILDSQRGRLDLLRQTFCAHPLVRKHVHEPEAAWEAMLTLNDGGISRLIDELALVADNDARLRRIHDQVEELAQDLAHRLGSYYQAQGMEAAADKERLAVAIVSALNHKIHRIGDLLYLLQPAREPLRALYLRTGIEIEDEPGVGLVSGEEEASLDLREILGVAVGSDQKTPELPLDGAARYARDALRAWVLQLEELADREALAAYFNLSREKFGDLIRELILAADRHGLESAMADALRRNENLVGTLREHLAARQVDVVFSRICGFIDYLEALSPAGAKGISGSAGFALGVPVPRGQLPDLPPESDNIRNHYLRIWFRALRDLIVNNAGYTINQEISPGQNRRLGALLGLLGRHAHPA